MHIIIKEYREEMQMFYNHLTNKYDNVEFIVLTDDFFLPKGFTCITEYFINQYAPYPTEFKDIYYAFIDIPELWSVEAQTITKAVIKHNGIEKGYIYYLDTTISKPFVRRIEWLNEQHQIYKIDYYNRYGFIGCSDYIDNGKYILKTYFDNKHRCVLSYDYSTDSYTTIINGITDCIFSATDKFYSHIFNDFVQLSILADTLSVIPKTLVSSNIIYYENSNENREISRHNCLVFTHSDQIESLQVLVESLPNISFHICADTMVSDYLLSFSKHENVSIYPGISLSAARNLLTTCDIYLDINHGKEIFNAIELATINNLLILGFDNTVHNSEYLLSELLFDHTTNHIVMKLQDIDTDPSLYNSLLLTQNQLHN